jgi:hypothetical protein
VSRALRPLALARHRRCPQVNDALRHVGRRVVVCVSERECVVYACPVSARALDATSGGCGSPVGRGGRLGKREAGVGRKLGGEGDGGHSFGLSESHVAVD